MGFWVANALGDQTFLGFVKQPTNLCDFGAVLPLYLDVFLNANLQQFRLLKIARVLRLLRLVHLAKNSAPLAPVAIILAVVWSIYLKTGLVPLSSGAPGVNQVCAS